MIYSEDPLQKTNQGGLQCKVKPKVVKIYPASDQNRDPITYFKKYCSLLPQGSNCKKLYLRPRKVPHPCVWYCDQPYRVNKVKSTIKDICQKAGLQGKFTNHSLRATCATRMYDRNIPEQIIKETTGHRSECVRGYKRTSDELKEVASNALSEGIGEFGPAPKIRKIEVGPDIDFDHVSDVVPKVKPKVKFVTPTSSIANKPYEMSMSEMMHNVLKSRLEMRKKLFPKSRLSLNKYRKNPRSKGHNRC